MPGVFFGFVLGKMMQIPSESQKQGSEFSEAAP